MSDNVKVKPSTAANAVNVATDEVSSIHYPIYKMAYGADGSVTQVDATNPIPVASYGVTPTGVSRAFNISPDGHQEVYVHGPRNPFGSIHAEKLSPVFNTDAVYGIVPQQNIATTGLSVGTGSGSGSVTAANQLFTCSTGTTQYSFGTLQSRRRLRYRAGQGMVGRAAGYFTGPVANSIAVIGFGSAESGYYFGYNGTEFGVLHSTGGVREIHTFTVTTASTATNDYVVTLPNTDTVSVTATNNSSTARTAYEIAQGDFPGWSADAVGSTVVFVASSVGAVSGSFSLAQTGAGTPAAGTDAETVAGSSATDTWVAQADWNGADILDGNGDTGVTLDPTKGNVFEIGIQYLGFGVVEMRIEAAPTIGMNNSDFITVHTFKFPNTLTGTHVSQPSFPFTMAAYSAGSTTDVTVNLGSYAGFIEGDIVRIGPRQSIFRTTAVTSSISAYVPLFTIKNATTYNSRANQSVSYILDAHGTAKSNQGLTTFYLIRNANLTTGNPSFTSWGSDSAIVVDTAATACTFSENSDVEFSATVSETGNFNYAFTDSEIDLQPGESMTLCVRSVTATAVCQASVNIREDQ